MPAPQQPPRETSSATRCNKMVQGDGIMSYTCSLPQGHEVETSDPADPQPCYTVESSRSTRVWQNWAQREHDRKTAEPSGTVIQCPTCSEPAMRVTEEGGRCENCGATAEIQQDISAATYIGEPMLADDGVVAAAQHDTSERDADIIAAAKAAAPERLEDGCLGEHDPATSLRCVMRPAPPAGYDLAEVGPQPLRDEQVPDWLSVADGSPNPTAEQVKTLKDLRDEFLADGIEDTGYRIHFDNDESRVERYSISEETQALRERLNADPMVIPHDPKPGDHIPSPDDVAAWIDRQNGREPTKQREGDQVLPTGDESIPDDQSLVIEDMEARRKVGVERYGQGHRPFNGRNTLLDAYEESLDGAVYLRSLLRARAATKEDLIDALAHTLGKIAEEAQYPYDISPMAVRLANAVTDYVTLKIEEARASIEAAEDAKTPARQQVVLALRSALRSGPHKMDEEGSWVSVGYVLDVLDEIGRPQSVEPEPAHVSGSLTERLDRIEEVLRPLGIINRAVAMHIDGLYVDKDVESSVDETVTEPLLAPVTVRDLLMMVEDEFEQDLPTVDLIAQWPEEVRYEVQQWATAVHLVASDNDMEIPQMPEVLR